MRVEIQRIQLMSMLRKTTILVDATLLEVIEIPVVL